MVWGMVKGSGTSLSIFFLTLIFAIPLGVLIYFGKKCKIGIISGPCKALLLVVRGTPLMLQLLIVYFGPKFIAKNIFGAYLNLPAYVAAIIAFSINYACYFSEIYRGGFESIPKGQYEAAHVLGYNSVQTFFRIILPQVIKRIVPAMGNEVITLVKDTSLVTIIGVGELMLVAKQNASGMVSFVPFIIAGVFYFVMNWAVALAFRKIEGKLNYYK